MSNWREEAIAEIAYCIDKNCTGGTDEDCCEWDSRHRIANEGRRCERA